MENVVNFIQFILLAIGGVLFELLIYKIYQHIIKDKKKKHGFNLNKYLFLLIMPFVGIIYSIKTVGNTVLIVFITFSLIGMILEWLIGFSYHYIIGDRLWTYNHYPITGYTSILTIPLWGLAGVLFWLLARIFT